MKFNITIQFLIFINEETNTKKLKQNSKRTFSK